MLIALVENGKLISDTGNTVAVPWWSFAKTVIAAATLVLVRDGLLVLDQTVEEQPFTVRQLLRHEAGLPDYGELPDYHAAVARGDPPWSYEEMLARTDAKRLRYPPGNGWAYSNIGYLYLRLLIERKAGQEFGAALQRLILHPLGIADVRLAASREDLADVEMGTAAGYDPRWVYHGLLTGPLYQAALLLDRLMTGSLLPTNLLAAMLDRRSVGGPVAGRPWIAPAYGLGIMTGEVDAGISIAGHTGGGPGSVIAVYRDSVSPASPSCAAFATDSNVGSVERETIRAVARHLKLSGLPGSAKNSH
jgi:CubicO group peptidase (beta-lactamase class C family)